MATKFDGVRNSVIGKISEMLNEQGYDVLTTGSQEICIPILSEDKDEGYLVMTFKIPKGSRDGDVYDGYSVAEDYALKCKMKAEKQKKIQAEKQKKIDRDKKMREQLALNKAKRLKKGENK